MNKIIGFTLLGFGIAWFSFMMFTSYYLYKRDEIIRELLEENKVFKEKLKKVEDLNERYINSFSNSIQK